MRRSSYFALAAVALLALPGPASAACSWKLVTSVSPLTINTLAAVSGTSTSDVWAVGKTRAASGVGMTLAEHWDGTAWTVVSTPNPDNNGNILAGVAAIAPNDAWAVGYAFDASGGGETLAFHWDGSTWTSVKTPAMSGRVPVFTSVYAVSAKDVWAAGYSTDESGNTLAPLVENWNGKVWTVKATPNLGTYGSEFATISGSAANDIWAIGATSTNVSQSSYVTFTEHWNGKKWSIVASPNANSNDNLFNAGVSIAPNDVWAIGDYFTGSIFATLTEHWNGTAWSIVKSPKVGSAGNGLFGATAFSTSAVWAVGTTFTSSGANTLSIKWNGSKWTTVKSPNLPGGNPSQFNAAGAIPGSTTLWGVGSNLYPSSGKPDQTLTASDACATSDLLDDSLQTPQWFGTPRGLIHPLPGH
jgi:hypothetical protein